jgi:hypothetical protein
MSTRKPSPDEVQPHVVRSDLNLEKWPVYVPSDSRLKPHARVFERETTLSDGRRVTASVKVGYTDLGMLITDDQKVFCALLKLWEEDGRPEILHFSLRRLADALRRQWNGKLAKSLNESLLRLRSTPFVWTNAYEDASTHELLRLLKTFTILDDLEIAEKAVHGHTTGQSCRAQFHPLIDANIRLNHSKPILYDTIIGFESGVAQLLYRHIDIVMWTKSRYVCRTKKLFEEIGLEGEEYKYLSRRRRTLERAFRELNGAPITSGIVRAELAPAKDGKDLNAVFTKLRSVDAAVLTDEAPSLPESVEVDGADERRFDDEDGATPEAIVRHFYRAFHGHAVRDFNAKELGQAATLLEKYGYDVSRHTVDFARNQTSREYRVQSFGYVLTFADRARADYAARQDAITNDEHLDCTLCRGSGRLGIRTRTGDAQLIGCPHDEQRLAEWERLRGIERLVR